MKKIQWKVLAQNLGISLGAGILGGIVTSRGMQDYEMLYKPPLTPPAAAFPVVWTILYILMGVAAYLVYEAKDIGTKKALTYYFVQLAVNVSWSFFFFGIQAYWLSFFWLLLLWYLLIQTVVQFREISPVAGRLLYPYLLWVTFAGYLNLAIAMY